MVTQDINRQIQELKNRHRRRSAWQKVVITMCCVVVFCVTYALILPAITMSNNQTPEDSREARQHEESSCEDIPSKQEAVNALTREEQAQEDAVIARNDALPTRGGVFGKFWRL